jgi:hypothetical protein
VKRGIAELLIEVRAAAGELGHAGGVLSGEAAAHAHVAAATGTAPGGPPRYAALVPKLVEAIFAHDGVVARSVHRDESEVAAVLRPRLDLFVTSVTLADGTVVPTLTREAVLAQLLAKGGLAIALAGSIVALANRPAIDVDQVREILKSAGLGERFQPLLELLDVA